MRSREWKLYNVKYAERKFKRKTANTNTALNVET